MDATLGQYLKRADDIHASISRCHSARAVKNKLYELESIVKQIQSVSYRIVQIYNSGKAKLPSREQDALEPVGAFAEPDSWITMLRSGSDHKICVAPNMAVRAYAVEKVEDVPNSQLYWIRSLNQFAIRVNGVIFRGNIGNVYNGTGVRTILCKHAECKRVLDGELCGFYHDIANIYELYKEKKITAETLEKYKVAYRNYTARNIVGNRNTLKSDLYDEFDGANKLRDRMFHDFLTIMAINQRGLIDPRNVKMISDDYSGADHPI